TDTVGRAASPRPGHPRQESSCQGGCEPIRPGIAWPAAILQERGHRRPWGLPFGAASDFGLFHINLDSDPELKRVPTRSSEFYKKIISEEGGDSLQRHRERKESE